MDRHDCLDPPEELILLECVMQVYRHETCLPVVAVNDVRAESDHREHGKNRLGEEREFLQIPGSAVIRLRTAEIVFVVDKVELNAVILHLHDSHIAVLVTQIHVEMSNILHFILPFLFHAGIFRKNDADIKVTLVKTFGKCACYVRKSAGFDKRYCL